MRVLIRKWSSRLAYYPPVVKKKRRKNTYLIILILILAITLVSGIIFNRTFMPMALNLASAHARRLAHRTLNQVVAEKLAQDKVKYEDICNVQRGPDGNITAIIGNTMLMNEFKTDIFNEIDAIFDTTRTAVINVPLGSMFGHELFTNAGPIIPVTMRFSGRTSGDFESSFTSAGINQTNHEISLNTTTTVSIVFPTRRETFEFDNSLPISNAVIVGAVPSTVVNIDGGLDVLSR